MKKFLFSLLLIFSVLSCSNDFNNDVNNDVNDVSTLLYGRWEMKTEQIFSKENGIENISGIGIMEPGESIITFSKDGTGMSNEGTFSYTKINNELYIYYSGSEAKEADEFWLIEELKSDELILRLYRTYIDENNYGYFRCCFDKK